MTYPAHRAADVAPTHPGAILREDVLPALKMTVSEVADRLGVTRQTLHRVLSERVAVTPEMAVRLGKFLGNGPSLWSSMQEAYNLWHAERELAKELPKIRPVKKAA